MTTISKDKSPKGQTKKRKNAAIDDQKLFDLNQNYLAAMKMKEHHSKMDLEEHRSFDRHERRQYEKMRRSKRQLKADSARTKWKSLRDTFRGELRKVNKNIANGAKCRTTNWEYFKEMVFVKDQIYSNRRSLAQALKLQKKNIDVTADSSVEEVNGDLDISALCKTEVVECDEEIDPLGGTDDGLPSLEAQPCITSGQNVETLRIVSEDSDYNFLMSILPQLRSLPLTKNLYVRLKIQELIYKETLDLPGPF